MRAARGGWDDEPSGRKVAFSARQPAVRAGGWIWHAQPSATGDVSRRGGGRGTPPPAALLPPDQTGRGPGQATAAGRCRTSSPHHASRSIRTQVEGWSSLAGGGRDVPPTIRCRSVRSVARQQGRSGEVTSHSPKILPVFNSLHGHPPSLNRQRQLAAPRLTPRGGVLVVSSPAPRSPPRGAAALWASQWPPGVRMPCMYLYIQYNVDCSAGAAPAAVRAPRRRRGAAEGPAVGVNDGGDGCLAVVTGRRHLRASPPVPASETGRRGRLAGTACAPLPVDGLASSRRWGGHWPTSPPPHPPPSLTCCRPPFFFDHARRLGATAATALCVRRRPLCAPPPLCLGAAGHAGPRAPSPPPRRGVLRVYTAVCVITRAR